MARQFPRHFPFPDPVEGVPVAGDWLAVCGAVVAPVLCAVSWLTMLVTSPLLSVYTASAMALSRAFFLLLTFDALDMSLNVWLVLSSKWFYRHIGVFFLLPTVGVTVPPS